MRGTARLCEFCARRWTRYAICSVCNSPSMLFHQGRNSPGRVETHGIIEDGYEEEDGADSVVPPAITLDRFSSKHFTPLGHLPIRRAIPEPTRRHHVGHYFYIKTGRVA